MDIDFSKSVLLIVDVQNDFCQGGALEVPDGDAVIEPLNRAAHLFAGHNAPVIATQDWHPVEHCSFARYGGIWPEHCVQDSFGAALHVSLALKHISLILRKGFRPELDSYSTFFENDRKTPTGLDGYLRALGRDTVYIGGLALDYCVFFSALDAVSIKLKPVVLMNAVKAVNRPEGQAEETKSAMKRANILLSDGIA